MAALTIASSLVTISYSVLVYIPSYAYGLLQQVGLRVVCSYSSNEFGFSF